MGRLRTPEEMRQCVGLLKKALHTPCCCKGSEHEMECYLGSINMQGSILAIMWALGESEEYQQLVDEMIRQFG